MTTQDAYERMREWLTRPGATRAISRQLECMYSMPDGNKCAVGCLLNDDTLGEVADDFITASDLIRSYDPPELWGVNVDFLQGAQTLHDNKLSWEGGKFNVRWLDRFAEKHGLKRVYDAPSHVPEHWVAETPVA